MYHKSREVIGDLENEDAEAQSGVSELVFYSEDGCNCEDEEAEGGGEFEECQFGFGEEVGSSKCDKNWNVTIEYSQCNLLSLT